MYINLHHIRKKPILLFEGKFAHCGYPLSKKLSIFQTLPSIYLSIYISILYIVNHVSHLSIYLSILYIVNHVRHFIHLSLYLYIMHFIRNFIYLFIYSLHYTLYPLIYISIYDLSIYLCIIPIFM